MPGIEAAFFDVREKIVDETREYGAWADWLSVPQHTFSGDRAGWELPGDVPVLQARFRPGD